MFHGVSGSNISGDRRNKGVLSNKYIQHEQKGDVKMITVYEEMEINPRPLPVDLPDGTVGDFCVIIFHLPVGWLNG